MLDNELYVFSFSQVPKDKQGGGKNPKGKENPWKYITENKNNYL